ncbi:MAG: hypothetical protein AB8B87_21675 [Granulosicoccus sp.]
MWWLVTLLVLALVSFFFVKSMKASTERKQAEHNDLQRDAIEATSASQQAPAAGDSTGSASSAQAGAAATATAGVAAAAGVAGAASSSIDSTPVPSGNSGTTVNTGDTLSDVREMIKILNLDGPDATRLELSREELTALRKGENSGIPDTPSLENVATKLRQMLA